MIKGISLAPSTRMKLAASGHKAARAAVVDIENQCNSHQQQQEGTEGGAALAQALRGKIAQQAQELTVLNDELVKLKDDKLGCERRINELLARQVLRPPQAQTALGGRRAATSMCSKRQYEKDAALKMDAMEKALEAAEFKQEELQKQKANVEQRLEEAKREVSHQRQRVFELTADVETLNSHLNYAQRSVGGGPSARRKMQASGQPSHFYLEEIKKLRGQLERQTNKTEKAADAFKESERALLSRIEQLEDALLAEAAASADHGAARTHAHASRTAETTGQAGALAAENAHLRGELAALQDHLSSLRHGAEANEADKAALRAQCDASTKQATDLQERLQNLQLDNDRLHVGELGARLRVVEKERDVLVEFVQSETAKHSQSLARAEEAESNFRTSQFNEQTAMEKLRHTMSVLEAERQRREGVEGRLLAMADLQASLEELRAEKLSLQALLDRRLLEAEEIGRLHLQAVDRLQAREQALAETEGTVREQQGRIVELSSATRERDDARAQLSALRDTLSATTTQAAEAERRAVRLETTESEVLRLNGELGDAQRQLERLAPQERLLTDLSSDLRELVEAEAQQQEQEQQQQHQQQGQGQNAHGGYLSHLPLSGAHHAWVSLPSLRHLHSGLYARVKQLAADLYRVEVEAQDLRGVVTGLQRECDGRRREVSAARRAADEASGKADARVGETRQALEETRAQLLAVEKSLSTKMQRAEMEHQAKARALEAELAGMRSCKALADQVRSAVRAFTGTPVGRKRAAVSAGAGGFDPATGRPIAPPVMVSDAAVARHDQQGGGLLLTDEQVGDLVSNVLAGQAAAARELRDLKQAHDKAKSDAIQVSEDAKRSASEALTLRATVQNLKSNEKSCQAELKEALLLVEKQNALGASLEAKLDSMSKERQTRMAQLASLMSREDTLRQKLLQTLLDYPPPPLDAYAAGARANSAAAGDHQQQQQQQQHQQQQQLGRSKPTENSKLVDLVGLASEGLARSWQQLQFYAAAEAYPLTRHVPPLPPTPATRPLTAQHATQLRAPTDDEGTDLNTVIAQQRRHMAEEAFLSSQHLPGESRSLPPALRDAAAIQSIREAAGLESVSVSVSGVGAGVGASKVTFASSSSAGPGLGSTQRGWTSTAGARPAVAGARGGDGNRGAAAAAGSVLSPSPAGRSPSTMLQARLQKARQAFASMREAHD